MKLFFRKYGEGPPLIMLHGLFGSSDNWVNIARALENCYTVYLPDLRNHGHSPWSSLHNFEVMADDILELADEQGLEKFFLAGHSMGGKTAMYCAVKSPERIYGLFIGDISPFPYDDNRSEIEKHEKLLSVMTTVDPSLFNDRNAFEDHLVNIAGEKETHFILSKNIAFKSGKMKWKLNATSLKSNFKFMLKGFPRPPHNIRVEGTFPVIFLGGSKSQYITDKDAEDIGVMFPGARILNAEGAGHWLHTDNPDDVIRAIKAMKSLSDWESCN